MNHPTWLAVWDEQARCYRAETCYTCGKPAKYIMQSGGPLAGACAAHLDVEFAAPKSAMADPKIAVPKITAFCPNHANARRRSFRIGEFTVLVEPHEDDKAQEEFTRKLAEAAAGLVKS